MYSVREDVGSVEVCAVNNSMVLLTFSFVVQVSTVNGSAIGEFLITIFLYVIERFVINVCFVPQILMIIPLNYLSSPL